MSRRVLGLDLGTRTGYAILSRSSGSEGAWHGSWDCSFKRGVDSPVVRIEKFAKFLCPILQLHDIDKVFYENVRRHNGTQAAHVYGALRHKMMELCEQMGVSYEGLEVAQWKKHVTGKGNASKDMVHAVVRDVRRFAVPFGAFDEADAIGVAICGLETRT